MEESAPQAARNPRRPYAFIWSLTAAAVAAYWTLLAVVGWLPIGEETPLAPWSMALALTFLGTGVWLFRGGPMALLAGIALMLASAASFLVPAGASGMLFSWTGWVLFGPIAAACLLVAGIGCSAPSRAMFKA